jgi:hypothetical protein
LRRAVIETGGTELLPSTPCCASEYTRFTGVSMSPDTSWLVGTREEYTRKQGSRFTVSTWNLKADGLLETARVIPVDRLLTCVDISGDGRSLFAVGGTPEGDDVLYIWDGPKLVKLPWRSPPCDSPTFSPDGSWLRILHQQESYEIFRTGRQTSDVRFEVPGLRAADSAFTPDSRFLVLWASEGSPGPFGEESRPDILKSQVARYGCRKPRRLVEAGLRVGRQVYTRWWGK